MIIIDDSGCPERTRNTQQSWVTDYVDRAFRGYRTEVVADEIVIAPGATAV